MASEEPLNERSKAERDPMSTTHAHDPLRHPHPEFKIQLGFVCIER